MPFPESSIAPIRCWVEIAGGAAAGLSAGAGGLTGASVVMLCRLTYRRPDGLSCRTEKRRLVRNRNMIRTVDADTRPCQPGTSDEQDDRQGQQRHRSPRFLSRGGRRIDGGDRRAESGGTGARAVPHRQGSSRPHRVVHVADPFDFQEPPGRRPRRRWRWDGGCAGWHRARRGGAGASGGGAGRHRRRPPRSRSGRRPMAAGRPSR